MGWTIEWLSFTVNEVATLGIVAAVCWVLRPNTSGIFAIIRELPAVTQLQALLSLDNAQGPGNATAEPTVPWDMSTTFIVEYPHEGWVKNISGDGTFKYGTTFGSAMLSKRRTPKSSMAVPMAVCVEERYDRKNPSNAQTPH